MKTKTISTADLCMIALFTAVIAIMAQISIPMPLGVPMTMQTFAITLAAVVLGAKRSALSSLIYVLLGAVGLPVFSAFTGGIQSLIGPTGGFIISFPIMAFIIGLGVDKCKNNKAGFVICLIAGTLVNYAVGVAMFCVLMNSTISAAFAACVLPFIPTAVIKAVLASVIGLAMRKRLGSVLSDI